MIDDVIVVAILIIILGGAIAYIVKEKKRGVRCVGCSAAGKCAASGKNTCNCSHNE